MKKQHEVVARAEITTQPEECAPADLVDIDGDKERPRERQREMDFEHSQEVARSVPQKE